MLKILIANHNDLKKVLPLFHEYRKFYRQEFSPSAEEFLKERLAKNESIILLAQLEDKCVGFIQLYKSFSSIGLGPIIILNDLFVDPNFRRKKIAETLILKTIEYAKQNNFIKVSLSTQISNTSAQELYKNLGFKKDNDFFYFNYKIN